MNNILRFWGVRGSAPANGPLFRYYGGHASCMSVHLINDQELIIFDAGTGIVELGKWIQDQDIKAAHLFISHLHLDHIMGLPMFAPLHDPQFKLSIYAKHPDLDYFFDSVLFNKALFPIEWQQLQCDITLYHIDDGQVITIENTVVKTMALNHPGGAIGYKLIYDGKQVCYLTDYEHDNGPFDHKIIEFMRHSHYAICDATYNDCDYQHRKGWGHSTNIRAAQLAQAADVRGLVFFHHCHLYDDDTIENNVTDAQMIFKDIWAAYDGMALEL